MHRSSSVALVCLLLSTPVLAVDGDKAQYMGGTIPSLKEKTDGRFITSDDKALSFCSSSFCPDKLSVNVFGMFELL